MSPDGQPPGIRPTSGRQPAGPGSESLPAAATVRAALTPLRVVSTSPVPDDLAEWATRCDVAEGFPLLGTAHRAEPFVSLQWNGERVARLRPARIDLVVLVGLVTAWQHDLSVGALQSAVAGALASDRTMLSADAWVGVPVTAGVVTTAVCAGLLIGIPEVELPRLVDVAGTLMRLRPPIAETAQTCASAAGHTAAAGWLASQVHLAGLTAYEGALADTLATATLPADVPSSATPVRQLVEDLQ